MVNANLTLNLIVELLRCVPLKLQYMDHLHVRVNISINKNIIKKKKIIKEKSPY